MKESEESLVPVFQTTDDFLLNLLRSTLEAAGVPHVVQGGAGPALFPLGAAGGRVTGRRTGATILVPESRRDEALEILRGAEPDGLPAGETPERAMEVLVLDFDGVVADSAREAWVVARRAYADLRPSAPIGDSDDAALYDRFLAMIPLGNRAEDYGTSLAALDAGRTFANQEEYDDFRKQMDPDWLRLYHERFYQVRTSLAEEDLGAWLKLTPSFARFVELLRRRAGEVVYAIATSKDRRSVEALIAAYGVADLFPATLVQDKEAGANKAAHLERLHDRLDIDYERMTFVDDKVNHLDRVASLGVRCALAAWGYNSPREHDLARARGYLVCTLDDVEGTVFGDVSAQD